MDHKNDQLFVTNEYVRLLEVEVNAIYNKKYIYEHCKDRTYQRLMGNESFQNQLVSYWRLYAFEQIPKKSKKKNVGKEW